MRSLTVVILGIICTGCSNNTETYLITVKADTIFSQNQSEISYPLDEADTIQDGRLKKITINSVGDLMVHRTQLIKADRKDHFDFNPSFQYVKKYFLDDDYTFANLETTFAGANNQRKINVEEFYKGYSGYPCFNTPDEFAQTLKDAGVDFVSTANNHCLDSGVNGLVRTIDVLDEVGIEHTGTFTNPLDAEELTVITIEGVTFGVINYTYSMNGFKLHDGDSEHVNTLDMYEDQLVQGMLDEVEKAESEVDFVVVMLHYGNEYIYEPDRYYQRPLINQLFESGADIILGGHPHVLQPIEVREITRKDGTVENGVVVYSLGNFLASQRRSNSYNGKVDTDIGVIFQLGIYQVDHHKPYIGELGYAMTYTHWNKDGLHVLPTYNVSEDISLTSYDKMQIEKANTTYKDHMKSYMNYTFIEEEGFYKTYLNSEKNS